jgi:hypothetical protein
LKDEEERYIDDRLGDFEDPKDEDAKSLLLTRIKLEH